MGDGEQGLRKGKSKKTLFQYVNSMIGGGRPLRGVDGA